MSIVEIYTSPFCGYCHRAKTLLSSKKVAFTEIDVMSTPGARQEMERRSEAAGPCRVFIDGRPIGGSISLPSSTAPARSISCSGSRPETIWESGSPSRCK